MVCKILDWRDNRVIWEGEAETVKEAIHAAIAARADLSGADLSWANLSGAEGVHPARCTPLLMLLDQPGPIRAYKLVNELGEGPINGGLVYRIGETVSVDDANTDPSNHCAAGINVATLDWCLSQWREGFRILVVEFTARDIAAIPSATDGKFRLHRCRVVAEKDVRDIVAATGANQHESVTKGGGR